MKRTIVSVLGVALAVVSVACSSAADDICTKASPCGNDVPATQAQKDQCISTLKANESSACYSEGISYLQCQQNNIVCGGDQKTDAKLSATQIENNCKNQLADVRSCCTKNPSATVCE